MKKTLYIFCLLIISTCSIGQNLHAKELKQKYITLDGLQDVVVTTSSANEAQAASPNPFIHEYPSSGHAVYAYAINSTSDGGHISVARKNPQPSGNAKVVIVKTDSDGNIQWQTDFNSPSTTITLFDVKQTADGGYIACGEYGTGTASANRGAIIKLNSSGGLTWAKTYIGAGGNGNDYRISFKFISECALGYVVTGYGGFGYYTLFEITSTGAYNYAQVILITTASVNKSQVGRYVKEVGSDYFVIGTMNNDASLKSGFFAQVTIATFNMPILTNFYHATHNIDIANAKRTSDGGYIICGYRYTTSSVVNAILIKLTSAGVISWSKEYDIGNNSERFYDVEQTSDGGYIVSGVADGVYASTNHYLIWTVKTDANGNVTWNNYPWIDAGVQYPNQFMGGITINSDGTYGIQGQISGVPERFVIMKANSSGQYTGCNNSSLTITATNYPLSSVTKASTVLDDILVHTDVITTAVGNLVKTNLCGSTVTPIAANFSASTTTFVAGGSTNFTDLTTGAPTSWSWSFPGGSPATSTQQNPSNITYNTAGCYSVVLTASNSTSSDTHTKVCYISVTSATTSANSPFINEYISSTNDSYAYAINPTSDGGFISVVRKNPASGNTKAVVIKTSGNGTIQWQTDFNAPTSSFTLLDVKQTADGGYIACGEYGSGTSASLRGVVVKLNSTGGVTWSKTYIGAGNNGNDFRVSFKHIAECATGYVVTGYGGFGLYTLLEIGSTGNYLYGEVEEIATSAVNKSQIGRYVKEVGTDYIIIGTMFNDVSLKSGFFSRTTISTFSMNILSCFSHSAHSIDIANAKRTSDGGYIVCGHRYTTSSVVNAILIKLDATGNITWSKEYDIGDNSERFHDVEQTSDGGYIVSGVANGFYASTNHYIIWTVKTDASGNVTWNNYPWIDAGVQYPNQYMGGVTTFTDGSYGIQGQISGIDEGFVIMKSNSSGQYTGCNNSSLTITASNYPITSATKTYLMKDDILVHTDVITNAAGDIVKNNLCGGTPVAANFVASTTTFVVGGNTNFTDLSTGSPTSWSWTFPGGSPGASSSQNPSNITYNTPGCYSVVLTASNTSFSNTHSKICYITVTSTVTGLSNQFVDPVYQLYPNPTSGILTIQCESELKGTEVVVYNSLGQVILSKTINGTHTELDTEALNAGIYFVKIKNHISKVIKE